MDKVKLLIAIENGQIEWRTHPLEKMLERNISRQDVITALSFGEIIEEYQTDEPYPSALFMHVVSGRPLHVVAAFDAISNRLFIITAYEPSLEKFNVDYITRRKKYE